MRSTSLRPAPRSALLVVLYAGAFALTAALPALAGDHGARRAPLLPAYAEECGACHAPFPPRGLPAASWQRLMSTLARHFGSDASLDPARRAEIGVWLEANAGRAAVAPPDDRLTRGAWLLREHHELSPEVWRRTAVGRPSNCLACHPAADRGTFSEHDVRIPR